MIHFKVIMKEKHTFKELLTKVLKSIFKPHANTAPPFSVVYSFLFCVFYTLSRQCCTSKNARTNRIDVAAS